jgi:hypothetical protein
MSYLVVVVVVGLKVKKEEGCLCQDDEQKQEVWKKVAKKVLSKQKRIRSPNSNFGVEASARRPKETRTPRIAEQKNIGPPFPSLHPSFFGRFLVKQQKNFAYLLSTSRSSATFKKLSLLPSTCFDLSRTFKKDTPSEASHFREEPHPRSYYSKLRETASLTFFLLHLL